MEWILSNLENIWLIVAQVIAVASMITALTPTPKDDAVIAKVQGFVKKIADLLAVNVLNAKKQ
jgi:hypothetical protein